MLPTSRSHGVVRWSRRFLSSTAPTEIESFPALSILVRLKVLFVFPAEGTARLVCNSKQKHQYLRWVAHLVRSFVGVTILQIHSILENYHSVHTHCSDGRANDTVQTWPMVCPGPQFSCMEMWWRVSPMTCRRWSSFAHLEYTERPHRDQGENDPSHSCEDHGMFPSYGTVHCVTDCIG